MLLGFSTAALILRSPAALSALLLIAVLVLLAGGVGAGVIWGKLRGLFGLIAMLFILQCLFNRNGAPALVLWGLTVVTANGLTAAALICLRLLVIVLGALMVFVGNARDYLLALTSLKVPYEIAFMVLAALRFLPILREEARDVLNAAQMRGLKLKKTGLKNQAGAYISLVLPVVAGAVRRAERLSIAMEARGFRALPRRTSMRSLRMRPADWVFTAAFCAVIAALLVLGHFISPP